MWRKYRRGGRQHNFCITIDSTKSDQRDRDYWLTCLKNHETLLHTFCLPRSTFHSSPPALCPWGRPVWTTSRAPFPSSFHLDSSQCEYLQEIKAREKCEVRKIFSQDHSLLGFCGLTASLHQRPQFLPGGFLQNLQALINTPSACLFKPSIGNGTPLGYREVLHPLVLFLNPAHTFVNSPFIKLFPAWMHHLFPAKIQTNRALPEKNDFNRS